MYKGCVTCFGAFYRISYQKKKQTIYRLCWWLGAPCNSERCPHNWYFLRLWMSRWMLVSGNSINALDLDWVHPSRRLVSRQRPKWVMILVENNSARQGPKWLTILVENNSASLWISMKCINWNSLLINRKLLELLCASMTKSTNMHVWYSWNFELAD